MNDEICEHFSNSKWRPKVDYEGHSHRMTFIKRFSSLNSAVHAYVGSIEV